MKLKTQGKRIPFITLLFVLSACALLLKTQEQAQTFGRGTPQEIHLSWVNDPKTTMTVMWQTEGETKTSTVQYGETQKLDKEVTGITETYDAATGVIHKAEVKNLKHSTTYYYKAGDKEAGWSNTFSFKTAPAKAENFTFVAMGDVGVTDEASKNVELIASSKPAFTLILGDLAYANGKHDIWDSWLNEIQLATANIPFMMTLGNHEYEKVKKARRGVDAYIVRFSHPGNEYYYSFDYAGAHFVSINCLETSEVQKKWLVEDLQKAVKNKAIWILAYFHYPPYSSSSSHGSDMNMRKHYDTILEKYGVDMVLNGHDHDYERTFPLKDDKIMSKEKAKYKKGTGTIYVVSGGGGAHLYGFKDEVPEWSAVREKTHEILKVSVSQNKLSAKAIRTNDKSVLDEFEVVK